MNSAIVINSEGRSSDQIDVVIHDPYYSPTLLSQNKCSFIPVEAVYAVFEVKPTINKAYLKYAAEKAASVRQLAPRTGDFKTIDGVRKVKPLAMISGLIAIDAEWADGVASSAFSDVINRFRGVEKIDCGVAVTGEYFHNCSDCENVSIKRGDNALAFFIFGLLRQLQLMGNAPGVDWRGYIEALNPSRENLAQDDRMQQSKD